MDPQKKNDQKTPPVVHHDRFTEDYYLQVIDLYRGHVRNELVHRGICEIASDRMRKQVVFKEDLEYCFEVCMRVGIEEDPAF